MNSTKQQILIAAERLFAEKGYHNVSMRAIANELNISVGNLTYHFPRKADLANALLEQELEEILIPARPGLAVLDEYLKRMLYSLVKHAKLFSDPLMFSTVPALAEEHQAHIERLRDGLLGLLHEQRNAGLFQTGLTSKTIAGLTDLLMYSHVGWQHGLAVSSEPAEQAVERMMELQWNVLRPYLTAKGTEQLNGLYPDG